MSIPKDDPWMSGLGSADRVLVQPERTALQIKTIEGVEPLDTQLGAFPKKTVPDALHDILFGQPEPTETEIEAAGGHASSVPAMQTYAILDAAKIINLPDLLEGSGLKHRCLFKGDAYDELKDVAPWIVRLEEGNNFIRNLFTRSDADWHLWDKEPGIYIRSRATLYDLWRHFRKLTRLKDENGKWFYFRFWDPRAAANPLFDFMSSQWDYSYSAWFFSRTAMEIKQYIYAHYDGQTMKIASLNGQVENHEHPSPPVISHRQRAHHANYMIEWWCYEMALQMKSKFSDKLSEANEKSLQDILIRCAYRMQEYGIKQKEYLEQIFFWEVFLGEEFEARNGYESVSDSLNNQKREPLKFEEVKRLMEQLVSRDAYGR